MTTMTTEELVTRPSRGNSRVVNHGPGNGLWEFRIGDGVVHPASGRQGPIVALYDHEAMVDLGPVWRGAILPLVALVPLLPSRRLPAELVEVVANHGRVLLTRQTLAGKGEAEAKKLRAALGGSGRHDCHVRTRLIEAV